MKRKRNGASYTLDKVKSGSTILNESISVFSENVDSNLDNIKNANTSLQEMTKGVLHQADSINIINSNMSSIAHEIKETQKVSTDVLEHSNRMIQTVEGSN